ncbi:DUF2793 domain-containing protein [Thalassobius vesicularis]|uniref:DUF2793 domain-containing protein n=1 Tax=Thalassobius vesicularis TaxID=1294297 RepID=A0A4V6RRY5_9RHOB|nr:DUF2793 domain-containing protein [Thalassobius vesicularis]THD76925.1 DUF2793 domain-containing protein [Thalassobius vesicularis]
MPLSSRLELPYLEPAQAQKHVTHNEALRKLDMLVQLSVQGFNENTPPALPVTGQVFALGTAPTGDWAGQADMLALREDTGWTFSAPQPGWSATLAGSAEQRIWDGTAWRIVAGQSQNLDGLGVNTSSDATNRLAVSAPATLLTHEGADHRLILNKAGAGNTASVLFQSGWSGHAEMGLAGSTGFSVKVSPNGTTWTQALTIDPATGNVAAPAGLTVSGKTAYHRGNLLGGVAQTGGQPTGAVIERGQNANGAYVRFADGTQICSKNFALFGQDINVAYGSFGQYRSANLMAGQATLPAEFAGVAATDVAYTLMAYISNYSVGMLIGGSGDINNFPSTLYVVSPIALTERTIHVRCLAVGRWF